MWYKYWAWGICSRIQAGDVKITVIGLGHVGLVAAAGLAASGHDVLAADTDRSRLDVLKSGELPFFEPGLSDWVSCGLQRGKLSYLHPSEFSRDLGEIALVAVGTPADQKYNVDLKEVWSTISWLKGVDPGDLVVVMKSTVPPGTGQEIVQRELEGSGIAYVANPEFLRQGQAVMDWQAPDRIVVGAPKGDLRSVDVVSRMYAGTQAPIMVTDVTSAEMIKYASNAFLATRISFINEIAALCDLLGASTDDVSEGLALDSRVGSRIYAGVGYGGSCLPKDTRILEALALNNGLDAGLLRAVTSTNNRQRMLPLHALRRRLGGSLARVRVGVLGLAYKPRTDDVRDAPALDLLRVLDEEGANIAAYDPEAIDSTRRELKDVSVEFATDVEEASNKAQALVLMTDWPEFTDQDWTAIARKMAPPRFIFDGRNVLDPVRMRELGFEYMGVGRPIPGQETLNDYIEGPSHA